MGHWAPFPYAGEYAFTPERVKRKWSRLHAGDREPLPREVPVLQAWAHFHSGAFEQAHQLGLSLGPSGYTVANKAACVYASFLEPHEAQRVALFEAVIERTEAQLQHTPQHINARYLRAWAWSRLSQNMSVAKVLAQGVGARIKADLEHVIAQQPNHTEAHVALGCYHAEVIDKVGSLIGAMAYGASREVGLRLFRQALSLQAKTAVCLTEYAHAMLMFDGEKMAAEATRMLQLAALSEPLDAFERLDVELARVELKD